MDDKKSCQKEWEDMTEAERAALRLRENPNEEPTGNYTGRCGKCHSEDLWADATLYGCNKCGAMFSNE